MNLQDFVRADDKIASLPSIFYELQEAVENPDSSYEEIQNLISMDPGLTARLLRIVNSPFYGFNTRIDCISRALDVIGLKQLSDLVLSTVVVEQFKGIPARLIDMNEFWRHSIACGLGAKIIASHNGESHTEPYFVAGLLHDIGHLAICMKAPEKAREIFRRSRMETRPVYEVELEELGFTHAEVGALLIKMWRLSPGLQETVLCHHNFPAVRQDGFRAAAVHAADAIINILRIGGDHENIHLIDQTALKLTGIGDIVTHAQVVKEIFVAFDKTLQGFVQTT